jgi:phosphatidylinositol-3-phosphatase
MSTKSKGFAIVESLLILVIAGLIGFVGWYVWSSRKSAISIYNSAGSSLQTPTQFKKSTPAFDYIVIIVEENKGYETVMGTTDAPYIHQLASSYSQADNYFALFHPSLPNYLAMTGGTDGGITDDCSSGAGCELNNSSIVDRIEASNRSWKGYMENMPSPCSLKDSGRYAVRHNPFVYYKNLAGDQTRCQKHDVPLSELYKDIEQKQLPNFSFVVPDLCNDMHDCPVSTGDKWLADVVPKILNSTEFKTKRSLLVITWDEAEKSAPANQIPMILAGPAAKKQYKSSATYNHYALLSTIEKAWSLSSLTNSDKQVPTLAEFLN